MAEAVAVVSLAASIVALVQISEEVIKSCKFYIGTVHDAPSYLRSILIETSAMKSILENLHFLIESDIGLSKTLNTYTLFGTDGPIEGCRRTITEMVVLLPQSGTSKRKAVYEALSWPLKQPKAKRLLDEMSQYKMLLNLAITTGSSHDIKDIKNQTSQMHAIITDAQRNEVYKWLTSTDPSPIHNRACKQYEPNTGDWVLRSSEWKDWVEGRKRGLWIHGIPGAGKTVLVSYLIENIKEHCTITKLRKSAFAYYYCYFGHNQDEALPFLRWILDKLSRQANMVSDCLWRLSKEGSEPSLTDLLRALEAALDPFDQIFLMIDAVDESMPREDLLTVLRDLLTDARFQKIRLLASSRRYIDIEKVMDDISVPFSMTNPLLDDDIRLYVRAKVETNSRIKRWPLNLRDEVIETLSTRAKGMFRWAVCQIDALQGLRPDNQVVKNALANLPKDLDETYERIFLGVRDDYRVIVRLALLWIFSYNDLYQENIPCSMLLGGIQRVIYKSNNTTTDCNLDQELLRELCGCLISVTSEEDAGLFFSSKMDTASFAHYTVWEFLESSRISPLATYFSLTKDTARLEFAEALLVEVLDSNIQGEVSKSELESREAWDDDLNTQYVASSVISIKNWGKELTEDAKLRRLIFNLLDPLGPHFQTLSATLDHLDTAIHNDMVGYDEIFFDYHNLPRSRQFWLVRWRSRPKIVNFTILLNLILLDSTCSIAAQLLQQMDIKEVFNTHFDIEFGLGTHYSFYTFEGSIVEFFAQIVRHPNLQESFNFLLEAGVDMIDPSKVLLSYIGSHNAICGVYSCREACYLKRLIKLGAIVDVPGYKVTPLQIAAQNFDYKGVRQLLEAGANPNGCGDPNGIGWEEGTFMGRLKALYGRSPLECQWVEIGDIQESQDKFDTTEDDRERITKLLIQYGARETEFEEPIRCYGRRR